MRAVSGWRDLGAEDNNVKVLALPLIVRELEERFQQVYHHVPIETLVVRSRCIVTAHGFEECQCLGY